MVSAEQTLSKIPIASGGAAVNNYTKLIKIEINAR